LMGDEPEIANPIIRRIAVYVVNLQIFPDFSVVHQPDNAVD